MPRTKIVCTLGPASSSEECLRGLIRAGMNVARFNFSHGTREEHASRLNLLRRLAQEEHAVVAALGDLQGPKIRIGEIPGGERSLAAGDELTLATQGASGTAVTVDFPFLTSVLKPGDRILLADGEMELVVIGIEEDRITTRVITGGQLLPHKGVNLPGIDLPIPSLTQKDREDAAWAIERGFDYLALSFVRRAQDIQELCALLQSHGSDLPVIAKVEKKEALANIDAILDAADGVMVARGDLGVETPIEQVPIHQKEIIRKANALGKPVITATQMLESMTHNPRPTRAEATDVANAILDGTDAVMLSEETSIGQYPLQAVQAMARIADFTEKNLHEYLHRAAEPDEGRFTITDAIGLATCEIAAQITARLIITITLSGYTARMVSRHRPKSPILAITARDTTLRRLALVWGTQAYLLPGEMQEMDELVRAALDAARAQSMAQPGDRVLVTAGVPVGAPGRTNMLQVREIE